MKNLSAKQIEQIKELKPWNSSKFHGNRKTFKGLPVLIAKQIIDKKFVRAIRNRNVERESDYQLVKRLVIDAKRSKGTNYFKIMIEGNTGIYYAHPDYQHSDYNKSRLFNKNEKTLRLMNWFNKIINK